MQTAEEFANGYLDALDRDEQPQLAKRIEARDAAAKLEVLQEFEDTIARWGMDGRRSLGDAYHRTMDELRARYAKAGGGA